MVYDTIKYSMALPLCQVIFISIVIIEAKLASMAVFGQL